MPLYRVPNADPTKNLTRTDLTLVLDGLQQRARRFANTRLNVVLFRLAACCGVRVSEIAPQAIADVRVDGPRPQLRMVHGAAKGGKHRNVPLRLAVTIAVDHADAELATRSM